MKQNHKKIKIYSEALCGSVDTFEGFQDIKTSLHGLAALSTKDLTINTFLKSKSVDPNQKMNIFTEAFKGVFNDSLLDMLLVMIENDDINLLIDDIRLLEESLGDGEMGMTDNQESAQIFRRFSV